MGRWQPLPRPFPATRWLARASISLTLLATFATTAWSEMTIGQSVGKAGKNLCEDVRVVQYLLNQIPAAQGGAAGNPLTADGKSGPKTEAAILAFQTKNSLPMDSRVDPNGMTLKKLNQVNPSGDFAPGRSGKTNADGTPASVPHPGEAIAWGNVVTAAFKAKVVQIAAEIEASPSHLMAAMAFESGRSFRPDINNPASCAIGLIQFTSPTAQGLGTSQLELLRMDAVDQLDFVKKYMSPFKGKLKTLPDVYLAILNPSFVGKPDTSAVFTKADDPVAYEQNKGLDTNMDGTITKQEAAGTVQKLLDEGLKVGNAG